MEDEFIEDDFLEEEEGTAGNRLFMIIVGVLVTVFILAAACALVFLLADGRNAGNAAAIAAVETENAITLAQNATVEHFIAQTEAAAAVPTDPPAPTATSTSTPSAPTATAPATNTPVLDVAAGEVGENGREEESAEGSVAEAATAEAAAAAAEGAPGTIVVGEEAAGDKATTEAVSSGAGAVTLGGTPTAVSATGAQTGALPQTGMETWVIALAGLLLVGVLIVAHRLRAN